jgi:hypothetical protein
MPLIITIDDPEVPHERRSSEIAYLAGAAALAIAEFQRGCGHVREGEVFGISAAGTSHSSLGRWTYTSGVI